MVSPDYGIILATDNFLSGIAVIIGLVLAVLLINFCSEKMTQKRLAPYQNDYDRFVAESKPTCPKDKGYPEATLFRHIWRRAVVLQVHLAETQEQKDVLEKIQEIAARNYFACAPENAYGKVKLQITPNQILEYLKRERTGPRSSKHSDKKKLACIYLGKTKDGKMYVGKTDKEPEMRWVQHRKMATGPFKNGSDYAEWEVIRGNLPTRDLDNWESYYIGFFNTYEEGYNETPGNSKTDYDRGKNDRKDKIGRNEDNA